MSGSEASVAEFVESNPRAADILEEAGIDYCCGGQQALSAACARAGIGVEVLLRKVEQLAPADSALPRTGGRLAWEQRRLCELIEYILSQHHAYAWNAMVKVLALLARVVPAHGDKYPELKRIREIFTRLDRELTIHMDREEMLLFPAILRLEEQAFGATGQAGTQEPLPVQYRIHELIEEHDAAAEMMREIRRESHGFTPPEAACASWRELYRQLQELEHDLHWHVHLENNLLFPRALALEGATRVLAPTS